MKRTTPRQCSVLLPALLLGACQGISTAPRDLPRREIEVEVVVEPAFVQRLRDADAGLQQAIEEAVLAEADVGLRFYPVAARSYGQGQQRPAYRMSVRVRDLVIGVEPPSEQGEAPTLERLVASLGVVVEQRRDSAPPLPVAQARTTGAGPTHAEQTKVVEASYHAAGDAGAVVVERRMVVEAVQNAFRSACRSMLPAIDREFSGRAAAAPGK